MRPQAGVSPQVQLEIGNDPYGFISGATYKDAARRAKQYAVEVIDADRATM